MRTNIAEATEYYRKADRHESDILCPLTKSGSRDKGDEMSERESAAGFLEDDENLSIKIIDPNGNSEIYTIENIIEMRDKARILDDLLESGGPASEAARMPRLGDGKAVYLGDTVYDSEGAVYEVVAVSAIDACLSRRGVPEGEREKFVVTRLFNLSHKRPESSDGWERLEEEK